MDFSKDEMSRRFKGLNEIMETNNLNGVIIMGDTVLNAPAINVSQRYFTQNNLIESFQIMFCEKDGAPILISASPLQYEANKVRSQITDCVVSPRQIETLVEILREKNLCTGRIGCMLDMIPASWYIHLNREVPELALVEIGRELTTLHYRKSNEEIEKARTSAYRATSGLSPYRMCAHRAHRNAGARRNAGPSFFNNFQIILDKHMCYIGARPTQIVIEKSFLFSKNIPGWLALIGAHF